MKFGRFVPVCCLLVCAGLLNAIVPMLAQTPQYTVTNLGPVSGDRGEPFAINNSGEVTGYVERSIDPNQHAFLYADGVMSEFGFATGSSRGLGINTSGDAVGYFSLADGNQHAFSYSNGILTDLGTLGGRWSRGTAINDSNQVAGWAHLPDNVSQHAFLYSNGGMIDIGTLGGSMSHSYAINNLGELVGEAALPDGYSHAFLYSNGHMTDLGTGGGQWSIATGINDQGDVTGYFKTSTDAFHAFLYSNQTMIDLGTFGNDLAVPYAINNSRQIVGAYHTPAGAEREFLFSGGRMYDLDTLIADPGVVTNFGFIPPFSRRINDRGQIIVHGLVPGVGIRAFLLTPKLHFTSIYKSPVDGHIQLAGFGMTAKDYVIEAAPTPSGPFAKIGMLRTGDDGTFQFEDSANAGPRFYRVSYP